MLEQKLRWQPGGYEGFGQETILDLTRYVYGYVWVEAQIGCMYMHVLVYIYAYA